LHRRNAESRRSCNRTVHWDRHINLLLILVLLDRVRCTWRSNTLLVNAMWAPSPNLFWFTQHTAPLSPTLGTVRRDGDDDLGPSDLQINGRCLTIRIHYLINKLSGNTGLS
jgi:hypothetical protein